MSGVIGHQRQALIPDYLRKPHSGTNPNYLNKPHSSTKERAFALESIMSTKFRDGAEQTNRGVTQQPTVADAITGPACRSHSMGARYHSQSLPSQEAKEAYVDRFHMPISPENFRVYFLPKTVRDRRQSAGQPEDPQVSPLFPARLYDMLNDSLKHGFDSIISWRSHGRAFAIHDRDRFERDILPK